MNDRNSLPDDFDPFDEVLGEALDTSDRLAASPAAVDRGRTERGELEPRPDRARFQRKPKAPKQPKAPRAHKPKPPKPARRKPDDDDDIDLALFADTQDDDLLDDDAPRAPRRPRIGGVDMGAVIGGFVEVAFTAVLIALVMLVIGAVLVIAGRALGVLPGGAIDFAALTSGASAVVAPQPVRPAATSAPGAAAVQPTAPPAVVGDAVIQLLLATATPVQAAVVCRDQDRAAWWASIAAAYRPFTRLTPASVQEERNPGALIERLNIYRAVVADAQVPGMDASCVSAARAAVLEYMDASIERVRALTTPGGVPSDVLRAAEARLTRTDAAITAALWEVGALQEADSPVALGITRGSGVACGAVGWYTAVESLRQQFDTFAAQIDVATQPATTVRGLISDMQAVAGNADALDVPACAATPNALRAAIMNETIAAYQALLVGQRANADAALARAGAAEARYRAWQVWLVG